MGGGSSDKGARVIPVVRAPYAVTKWLSKGATWDPEILAELSERKVEEWRELPKGFHPVVF